MPEFASTAEVSDPRTNPVDVYTTTELTIPVWIFTLVSVCVIAVVLLVVAAFLLALLYGWLCRSKASPDSVQETQP